MEPLYKKIDASTPPEKDGEYLTNLGWTRYDITTKEWYLSNYSQTPNWYFLPVTGEKMSYSDALKEVLGFQKEDCFDRDISLHEAAKTAELYLSTNTAHLVEELERVKKKISDLEYDITVSDKEEKRMYEHAEALAKALKEIEAHELKDTDHYYDKDAVNYNEGLSEAQKIAERALSTFRKETKGGNNDNV